MTRITWSQASSIKEMWRAITAMDDPLCVTRATMSDTEPRGMYDLKALSEQLLAALVEATHVSLED